MNDIIRQIVIAIKLMLAKGIDEDYSKDILNILNHCHF